VTAARAPFGARLHAALRTHGPLCVGVDPHPHLLQAWGLEDTPGGLERFARSVVEAAAGRAAAVKPQSAFFERHGSRGVAVLEAVLADLADSGTLSILDAKRGDIGSTMSAYAQAYLADGAPLVSDALTVSPYLGYGSLRPAVELARATGRGLFVLALTSNPEGERTQHAGHPSVASRVVADVARDNAGRAPMGDIGLVVGANVGTAVADLGIDLPASGAPILAPGVGAQGAQGADLARLFAGCTDRVVAPVSRAVLDSGPGVPQLTQRITELGGRLRDALG
jgi:orotidine-5'-phosphate decarboxylase